MRCLNSEVDVLLSCSCHFPFIHLYPLLETATISWQTVWPYWFSGQGSLCCPLVALQTAKRKYCNMYQTYFFLICINYAMLKLFQKLWGNQYSSLLSVSRSMFGSICTIGVDFEVGVTAHSSVSPPNISRTTLLHLRQSTNSVKKVFRTNFGFWNRRFWWKSVCYCIYFRYKTGDTDKSTHKSFSHAVPGLRLWYAPIITCKHLWTVHSQKNLVWQYF